MRRLAADELVAEVGDSGGRTWAVRSDQRNLAEVEELFNEVDQTLDGLDILVVNAAINPPTAIADVTEAHYDRMMAVNAKGPFFAVQHAGRVLRDHGRIIAISTLNTAVPAPTGGPSAVGGAHRAGQAGAAE